MRCAALVAALLAPGAGTGAVSTTPDEYQVKAVFLFNFGRFVEWPKDTRGPFAICVVGDDPFGQTLDDVVRGESVNSRALVVRRYRSARELAACDIVFVGRGDQDLLADTLAAVRGHSVLTVTDAEGAVRLGAIIVLFEENNRIRMRINLAAARENHLVISSKLLRPAEVVGEDG
jgi:hypothetical protein